MRKRRVRGPKSALDEALFLLEEGVARMSAMQVKNGEAQVIAALGEACLMSGRHNEAAVHAERALKIAHDRGERGSQAWALRLTGEVAAADGSKSAAAFSAFREAVGIAEELGMRPLLAHCHLGLGQLHKRVDEREAASMHLSTALRLYREMDMDHWLQRAEAAADGYISPVTTA